MHQSRNNYARASGVSVNDRRANASRLRAKLAYHQTKFLLTNGNDQVRLVLTFAGAAVDGYCRCECWVLVCVDVHLFFFKGNVSAIR